MKPREGIISRMFMKFVLFYSMWGWILRSFMGGGAITVALWPIKALAAEAAMFLE